MIIDYRVWLTLKYRSTVSHWKSWGFSLSSLQAIPPPEYCVIFIMVFRLEDIAGHQSFGTPHSLTFLSQLSHCELTTDGKEVSSTLGLYTSVIEFEIW